MRRIMDTVIIGKTMDNKDWYIIDAEQAVLGRLASKIACTLKGKHKPTYLPHVDNGDYVVVINAKNLCVSGNKMEDKVYDKNPSFVIMNAVKGMLPKNPLGRSMIKKLKIYNDEKHQHHAQKPKKLEI